MNLESVRARIGISVAALLVSLIWALPNFVQLPELSWYKPDKLVYGLDIQGGLHIVMGVDTDGVLKETVERQASTFQEEFKEEGILGVETSVVNANRGEMTLRFASAEDLKKAQKLISDRYATMLQELESTSTELTVRFVEIYLEDLKKRIVNQAIETLRNRIDEFGVAEPSITAQGSNRILVQLPGIQDAEGAKSLINTTAQLKLMLVNNSEEAYGNLQEVIKQAEEAGGYSLANMKYSQYLKRLNQDLVGKIPEGTEVAFEKSENIKSLELGKVPYILEQKGAISGDLLKDAFVSYNEYGRPVVNLSFNPEGTRLFADVTTANTGRNMAIVLDGLVKTAPRLNEPIPNGRAEITLGNGPVDQVFKEAQTIALSLRAGALPAALEQLEERTIGPSLGRDSIESAKLAALLSFVLVLAFMLVWYRGFGLVSAAALLFNILMLIAILTSLRATLTLPGIAGMILTVGMAVDANIIIFERIREELRKGTGLQLAVKEGFGRALSAIIDANITTAIVCVVLMSYGSGPVRGFAITLLVGVFTSIFTAVFVSKALIDASIQNPKLKGAFS